MFVKGKSGNPGGRLKTAGEWREAIRWALLQKGQDKQKKIYKLAIALVSKGEMGDVAALKEIGDRIDGKPMQITEISGASGGPIQIIIQSTDARL